MTILVAINEIMDHLRLLLEDYNAAPEIYQAGSYWKKYEDKIISEIENADLKELRSGKYAIFGTFGFSESVYHYHPNTPLHVRLAKKIVRKYFITGKSSLPYSLNLNDIREMAYINCVNQGKIAGLKCISEIETSTYGNPDDLFEIKGKKYTMQFLNFYIRLCFAQQYLNLTGSETIVELGSGSGFQIEVLKKVFPNLTIICFDLPYPLVLCEHYLTKALPDQKVISSSVGRGMKSLDTIERGTINMFGNWQIPMLSDYKFDIFWNAASFGEMEPHIVKNYLSFVNQVSKVFLLQARKGKEGGAGGVQTPITFDDYCKMLASYILLGDEDAYEAHRRMSQSGGYFQAVWQKAD